MRFVCIIENFVVIKYKGGRSVRVIRCFDPGEKRGEKKKNKRTKLASQQLQRLLKPRKSSLASLGYSRALIPWSLENFSPASVSARGSFIKSKKERLTTVRLLHGPFARLVH